jgi:hypothetical protein
VDDPADAAARRAATQGLVAVVAVLVIVLLVSVLSNRDDDDGRTTQPPTTLDTSLVNQSEEVCRLYSSPEDRQEMASELGATDTSASALAEAWAEGFVPALRQEAYQGCLRGLS